VRLGDLADDLASRDSLVDIAGRVTEVSAVGVRISGLSNWLRLGDFVRLQGAGESELAEVVSIGRDSIFAIPFGTATQAAINMRAVRCGPPTILPHPSWKGRVIDSLAAPLDGAPLAQGGLKLGRGAEAPKALSRARVSQPLNTGVNVIDLFTPVCAGQRVGIFAGSGVGKTTLLAMLIECRQFDTVVVALVGERGREVREMVEDTLGPGMQKSIAVVATSDESPLSRRMAARTATTIAEFFRDRGENVLLIVDSLTRYVHALREIALAAGEPPVARGYPPSVFADIPRLLERAGPGEGGSGTITGLYSILVDGDDHNEPVADCVRGVLDGHIVLERRLANANRYPAVDPLASLSRLAHHAWSGEQAKQVATLRRLIDRYEASADLRALNAYRPGSDTELDTAVTMVPKMYELLKQSPGTKSVPNIFQAIQELFGPAGG